MCYFCEIYVKRKCNIMRSYAKESTKSNPSGIRFDLEKVQFVKDKEKLNTYQKVVDFLLNKYWWEFKVAKPTYKESPPLELKEEIKSNPITPIKKPLCQFDSYMLELKDSKTTEEVKKIMYLVKLDPDVSDIEEKNLEKYAKKISLEMYSD